MRCQKNKEAKEHGIAQSFHFLHLLPSHFLPPKNDTFWHLQKNENKNHKIVITLEVGMTSISSNHVHCTTSDKKPHLLHFILMSWMNIWQQDVEKNIFGKTHLWLIYRVENRILPVVFFFDSYGMHRDIEWIFLHRDSSNLYLTIF